MLKLKNYYSHMQITSNQVGVKQLLIETEWKRRVLCASILTVISLLCATVGQRSVFAVTNTLNYYNYKTIELDIIWIRARLRSYVTVCAIEISAQ